MRTPTAIEFHCQQCDLQHSEREIRGNNGCCARCASEVWKIILIYKEYGKETVAVLPIPHGFVSIQKTIGGENHFTYEDVSRDTLKYLFAKRELLEERILAFAQSRNLQRHIESGAQYCKVCGSLFNHIVHQPWFAAGCCSRSCAAHIDSQESETAAEGEAIMPGQDIRQRIAVSCSNGHSFDAPPAFKGCKRPCPECGEKCLVQ